MCDPQTFDSRDSRYKRPYGAVPSGTRVELALRPPRAGGFSAATLIAYFEHRDEERRELPMPWRGLEGDRDVFAVTLETGDYVGLVWYSFRLEGLDGRREELGPFQLTVYDGAEEVPAWFGEGVTYQIFPDRFCEGIENKPMPFPDRLYQADKHAEPFWQPNETGGHLNEDYFGGDLEGGAGLPPRLERRGAQPGLLWRRSGRRAGEAGLPAGPGGGYPLLLPHLRGPGEPPLRHRGL